MHTAFNISRCSTLVPPNTPGLRLRIVLSDYPCRYSHNHAVVRDTSCHYRIDRDDTVAAYCQLSFWTYDGCPMADPSSLTNSDSAAIIDTLLNNRDHNVLVIVIVVDNQDRLSNKDIVFQVDSIFGRYDTAVSYMAIVVNYDYRFTYRVIRGNIEPCVLSQAYGITKAYPRRTLPIELTCEMKRHIPSL